MNSVNYLHFILEFNYGISYFIGANTVNSTVNSRHISRKIVKIKIRIKAICQGGGQFFIKSFCNIFKPKYTGEVQWYAIIY